MKQTPEPPKPPPPPKTRYVKDCGNSEPLTKSDWVRIISAIALLFLLAPPVMKLYLFWIAVWS